MDVTSTKPSPEMLTDEWMEVINHAKAMQIAIGRYASHLQIAVNEEHAKAQFAKDVAFQADQLNDAGDAILTFTETIARDVKSLVDSLLRASSEDVALGVSRDMSAAQISALNELGTSALKIAASVPSTKPHVERPNEQETEKLSPAAQAIADGFERILDGKPDSRMSYGKIPHRR